MEKVFAGHFYGYEMYIEVPAEQKEFIKKEWDEYTDKIRRNEKHYQELKLEKSLNSL